MKRTTDPRPGNDSASTDPAAPAGVEPTPPGHPTEQDPAPGDLTVPELEEQAKRRGVMPEQGSGTDGNVVKADLVAALEDTPQPPAGRPPLVHVAQAAAAHLNPQED